MRTQLRLLIVSLGALAACGDFARIAPAGDSDGATIDAPVVDGPLAIDAPIDAAFDAPIDATPGPDPTNPTASAAIANARAMPDGVVDVLVDGATVTVVKPTIGADPAGFYVQAVRGGPALFVPVDPATLTPPPVAGDVVRLRVTALTTVSGVRRATIADYARISSGADLDFLTENVSSATDLVSALDSYESELITFDATVTAAVAFAGTGHVSVTVDTAGVTGSLDLRLRVPETVNTEVALATPCRVTVRRGIMGRFNAVAQPSVWSTSALALSSCPAPRVVSAVALSSTSARVTFDRPIAPASLTAPASQFTITSPAGNLPVSAAAAMLRDVTLTTGAQVGGAPYTVTAASTVQDTTGSGVDAAASMASFTGYRSTAVVIISEVNPNQTGGRDLIELQVLQAGTLLGLSIEAVAGTVQLLATLPDLTVAVGDVVVVHLGSGVTSTSEAASKGDCVDVTCYPNAWDVNGVATGLSFSNRVVRVRGQAATVDAVPFVLSPNLNPPGGFPADLQALQAAGLWLPSSCNGVPCDYMSTPSAYDVSVNWAGAGVAPADMSVRRIVATDSNSNADWALGASSWGAPNP